jgi:hypothetical protein
MSRLREIAARVRRRMGPDELPLDLQGEDEFLEIASRCEPFTMTSLERQFALYSAVRYIHANGVEGSFVECGVWRGGSALLAALTLQRLGDEDRELYLYDTFAGMTQPTSEDGPRAQQRWAESEEDGHSSWAYASLEEVEHNLRQAGIALDRVQLVRGPVEETIPTVLPARIALLRLDTDWYESTKHELEHMYDRVPPGGVILIDDYGHWKGARQAVDDFFRDRGIHPLLARVDYTGRMLLKR